MGMFLFPVNEMSSRGKDEVRLATTGWSDNVLRNLNGKSTSSEEIAAWSCHLAYSNKMIHLIY